MKDANGKNFLKIFSEYSRTLACNYSMVPIECTLFFSAVTVSLKTPYIKRLIRIRSIRIEGRLGLNDVFFNKEVARIIISKLLGRASPEFLGR